MTVPALARREKRTGAAPRPPRAAAGVDDLTGWAFAAPFVILFFVFLACPILASFVLSFTSFGLRDLQNPFGADVHRPRQLHRPVRRRRVLEGPRQHGLLRGRRRAADPGRSASLIAIALNRGITSFRTVFRVGYYLPVVTSIVAIAVVWRFLLNPDVGLVNMVLGSVGIDGPNWLGDPTLAMPSIIAMAVWRNLGFAMIVFLAGLQTIPASLYEAAPIDGAGRWQTFRHITLPLLRPTILFMPVITTIGYLQLFEEPFVMTDGGPLDPTLSVSMYMYQQGFAFFHQGYAAAIAYVLFLHRRGRGLPPVPRPAVGLRDGGRRDDSRSGASPRRADPAARDAGPPASPAAARGSCSTCC